jgi:nucleoside-diphosphate-sugar epimerase
MRVFIVGITGFLGYHAAHELLRRGHRVSGVALPPLPQGAAFPPEVQLGFGNLMNMPDEQVLAHLQGQEGVVFAAGADDRYLPKAPAAAYFQAGNVQAPVRLARLARQAGVKRMVVIGSYFAHFARQWPAMRLGQVHPYIRSRLDQEEQTIAAGGNELAVMVLELPYIFGAMPGRTPMWASVVRYARSHWPLFFMRGGSNMVAVQHVAEAVAGALERGHPGECYLVGDENVSWAAWLQRLAGRPRRVIILPHWVFGLALWGEHIARSLRGREGGLDLRALIHLQTAEAYFDPEPSRQALGYGRGGLQEAFDETVRAVEQ